MSTHRDHFYRIERVEFDTIVEFDTEDKCHVLMLVEGTSILAEVSQNASYRFNYAETFIVPAAVMKCRLINQGKQRAKVIKVYPKIISSYKIIMTTKLQFMTKPQVLFILH